MATLTLRNVPDELVEQLKEEAARNRRSVNQEVISRLLERDRASHAERLALLELIDRRRSRMPSTAVSPAQLKKWTEHGRL